MDLYKVVISPKALSQLNDYISYIELTLLNDQAANSVWEDAMNTTDKLACSAGSLNYCKHPKLKELGYRIVHFDKHRYLMLYRVVGNTAYVDAVYHELQDYENIFAEDL